MRQAVPVQLRDTFADIDEHFEPPPRWSGRREILVDGYARRVLRADAGATFIRKSRLNQPTGARHAGTDGQAIEEVVHERQEYFYVNRLFDYFNRRETPGLADVAGEVDRTIRPATDWSQHAVWFTFNNDARRRRI